MAYELSLYFLFWRIALPGEPMKLFDKQRNAHNSKKRIRIVIISFVLITSYLAFAIFRLDYILYDKYMNKALDQITTTTPLKARRGVIYDSEMNPIATDEVVYRVFVSTRDIAARSLLDGMDYSRLIADGLADILSLDTDALYDKLTKTKVLDVTIKREATEEEFKRILDFTHRNRLEALIFTEAQSSRVYPEGSFAAHLIGFVGSDEQGLYGLEYQYNDILSGKNGYYMYAKDAAGIALDTGYSTYVAPTDGSSLVTTIDSYIQTELEAVIEKARVNHKVENRVTGIVMDTRTGAILAMATSTPYDPNDPFTLDSVSAVKLSESGYAKGSDEYNAYKTKLLQEGWVNKAVSDSYEPGSTFKIITVAAALDAGVVSMNDTFSCCGYHEVGGWRIKCHKTTGHGSGFTLSYGLQMSCNPTMMNVAERLGGDLFYEYVKKFGYLEKSGIDIPSEGNTIFHKKEAIGATELATASFGQRFKVSIINQLTAIATVANGGLSVTPYVVERIIDPSGKVTYQHKHVESERVVSAEAARLVTEALIAGVDGDGGAKNAGVDGYSIAAKTGTSQKFDILDENGNSYLRIGSTVAYAPSENGGIAVIIVCDEPTDTVKYGSVVAAPYVSELLEKVLPYLDYESKNQKENVTVGDYVGLTTTEAREILTKDGLGYEIVGSGEMVISQTPSAGDVFSSSLSKVILYTEERKDGYVSIPSLVGLSAADAAARLLSVGLNVRFVGVASPKASCGYIVTCQSHPFGARVDKGTTVTVTVIKTDHED